MFLFFLFIKQIILIFFFFFRTFLIAYILIIILIFILFEAYHFYFKSKYQHKVDYFENNQENEEYKSIILKLSEGNCNKINFDK